MLSRRKARVVAFQALYEWDLTRAELDKLVEFPWFERKEGMTEDDLLFSRLLVAGTLENIDQIDQLISKQSRNWELKRLNKVDLALLRISVYAIVYQQDIPSSVTIDEAVEIAREYGSDESFRFINGILDGIRRSLPSS